MSVFKKSEDLEKEFNAKLLNRLDKETSGLILLYKDENFRLKCIEEFKKQRVYKSYLAIISGVLADEVTINEPILTIKSKQGAFSKVSKEGKSAQTTLTPLLVSGKKTLVKANISTGRTHQIRAHLESLNRHILGDVLYGYKGKDYERVMLHSYFLHFKHPRNEQKLIIKAPLYDDFMELLKDFDKGELDEKLSFDDLQRAFAACVECL